MQRLRSPIATFVVVLAAACGGASSAPTSTNGRRITNLRAFARLYGVVRWFHPSDAAVAIDWNRFAIEGARAVADAPDAGALRDRLDALFDPIAPTSRIVGGGGALVDDPALHPLDTGGLHLVRWEHAGFGDTTEMKVYRSQRVSGPYAGQVESVDLDLGDGLRARVPIELPARDGHTLGDDARLARWRQSIARDDTRLGPITSAADVIVVWNVLQHFWPYWDDVRVDWDHELDVALADALDDRTPDDHLATLERLSTALPDGHARVTCPGTSARADLPVDLEWVDGQVVIKASTDPRLEPGDMIRAIDGVDAIAALDAAMSRVSGSPQYRRVRALHRLGAGAPGSRARLSLDRGGRAVDVEVVRTTNVPYSEYARLPFELVGDGIWYVDLSRISLDDFPALLDRLFAARGIVFDLRHYPEPNSAIFRYLMTREDHTPWLHVPHFTRPDHAGVRWEDVNSTPPPDPKRHLQAPVAFLIGPRQFSFGESLAGFVGDLHLGALVGSPTGGINGNIAGVAEPSGCQTTFTGMRVTGRDGTQLYQRGIAPTAPVVPTIEGLRANRDEVLEEGIAIVRGAASGEAAVP